MCVWIRGGLGTVIMDRVVLLPLVTGLPLFMQSPLLINISRASQSKPFFIIQYAVPRRAAVLGRNAAGRRPSDKTSPMLLLCVPTLAYEYMHLAYGA